MHSNTKSNMIVVGYVDAAGIGRSLPDWLVRRGYLSYRGGLQSLFKRKKKSAEVIVVADTSRAFMEQHGSLTGAVKD